MQDQGLPSIFFPYNPNPALNSTRSEVDIPKVKSQRLPPKKTCDSVKRALTQNFSEVTLRSNTKRPLPIAASRHEQSNSFSKHPQPANRMTGTLDENPNLTKKNISGQAEDFKKKNGPFKKSSPKMFKDFIGESCHTQVFKLDGSGSVGNSGPKGEKKSV
jgi:hypothetical protein